MLENYIALVVGVVFLFVVVSSYLCKKVCRKKRFKAWRGFGSRFFFLVFLCFVLSLFLGFVFS